MFAPVVTATRLCYTAAIRPLLFSLTTADTAHERAVAFGERLGRSRAMTGLLATLYRRENASLRATVSGITFPSPIGLAAGFDYQARLVSILPALDFGAHTVGTLTHRPYGGNEPPMLGRLPRSRSLMVNKGFKNDGVAATLARLRNTSFLVPVGVSIGKTNDPALDTQRKAVEDVVQGFRDAERADVPFAYYELNVSCPNLIGTIEFYEPEHLDELLRNIAALDLTRPVFIKMPIAKTDDQIRAMMQTIIKHPFVTAAIFGNVQRDRSHPALVPAEVERFPHGNFSGAPCRTRSDELIRLAYREYGTKIAVIGCGGVMSAEDAYRKIRLGASLVQLVTGLVYEGPQLVADINRHLPTLLHQDGFTTVADAIGAAA